jgi:antitoxin (DNA-binding transcriptional repressor) of toxin-antitoxin stability system
VAGLLTEPLARPQVSNRGGDPRSAVSAGAGDPRRARGVSPFVQLLFIPQFASYNGKASKTIGGLAMTTKTIDLNRSQPQLAELLSLVTSGTEIILTEGDLPVARLVPVAAAPAARIAGLHAGAAWISEDFNALLPDEFWTREV